VKLNNWWLNIDMRKMYFHNDKSINQNINKKKLSKVQSISEKQVVDINKLLNRVKIDQKNETKQKIIFYSSVISGLFLLGTLITLLK
jgi:hypothetical protein